RGGCFVPRPCPAQRLGDGRQERSQLPGGNAEHVADSRRRERPRQSFSASRTHRPHSRAMRERRFEGKSVMVTGAGPGFGATLALRAAEEGARVVVHYRSSGAGAEATAAGVRERGGEALLVQGDITSWDDVKRMAAEVFDELGSLDALVNNVGDMASAQ